MLQFLTVCVFIVVFGLPLALTAITAVRQQSDSGEISVSATRWWLNSIWAVVGIAGFITLNIFFAYWVNLMWYKEVGYTVAFWTPFWSKIHIFCWTFAIMFAFFYLVFRSATWGLPESREDGYRPILNWVGPIASLILAVIFGLALAEFWQTFALAANRTDFNITDPIFSRDIAFYIFQIPVYTILISAAIWALILAIIIVVGVGLAQEQENDSEKVWFARGTQIATLGICLMTVFVCNTVVAKWQILQSTRGAVYGAGFTDVNVQLGAYNFFIAALVIACLCLLVAIFIHTTKATLWLAVSGFGLCLLSWLIGVVVWPSLVEKFSVEPNQFSKEKTYIGYNIKYTRQAFGLDDLKEQEFPVSPQISSNYVSDNQNTLANVRLWDWKILQNANNQYQILRAYYTFPDVDVVRYRINGNLTEMMSSGRELEQDNIPTQAKNWQNTRFVYTHGFGCCVSPVNAFTSEGLPDWVVKDIPVNSRFPELKVDEPRIYFGEKTNTPVYVKTKFEEFDYPKGEQDNATTKYGGMGGVPIGQGLRKLAIAWQFDNLRMLNSSEITANSRIMFDREIMGRISKIAPFLDYSSDPYQVVADGKLWFMIDAFTSAHNYPYSEPFKWGQNKVNYVRNSVKVVVDAYNGTVSFYIFDKNDPLIETWAKVFPGMFKDKSEMPASLLAHIRYPEELLNIQAEVYSTYHMTNPNTFYNREDVWDVAKETDSPMAPYYNVMSLPSEKTDEFVLMLPFTPHSTSDTQQRNNMTGWLAGRCDGKNYGKLICYAFPKGKLIDGPAMVSSRINTDTDVSRDVTFWNQHGSQVVWGNLLVIPLKDHQILYVQPMFLQASAGGKIPEMKRVVLVTSSNQMVYANSFEEGLRQLTGASGYLSTPVTANKSGQPAPNNQKDLIKDAAARLAQYQKLTGEGKYSEAGKEMEALTKDLQSLATSR